MAIQVTETIGGNIMEICVTGKLRHEDYVDLMPEFERLIAEYGKVRILFEMVDFHGWDASALWDDIKCDVKHFAHIDRIAMVGDKKWEKGMSAFCRPFTTAKIRYFDLMDIAKAHTWLEQD